jgi:hypothetical protein
MSRRILQSLGLLGFTLATALVTLFAIDRVMPSPLILLPLLVTAPAMVLGATVFAARRRSAFSTPSPSPLTQPAPRLESIVFVSPVLLGRVRPHATASFVSQRRTA